MKILMLLEKDFPPDGRVEYEIQELVKGGQQVDMLCVTNKETHTDKYLGGKVFRFHQSKFYYKIGALALQLPFYFNFWMKNLKQVMQKNEYDVIHIHDLPLTEVGLRARKKWGVKLVADYHENRPEIMKYYPYLKVFPAKYLVSLKKWHNYQKRVSPLADKLILVTPEAKEYYIDKFNLDPDRISIIPNYANIKTFSKITIDKELVDELSKKFYVVYFGDTGIRRGTLDMIYAASKLQNKADIQFVIIGDSTEQTILQNTVKKLGLNNVQLTGYMPFNRASSYMYGGKVGVCPFHRNVHHDTTYANKMFQYLYYGLPVIVSDCPSQQIIVEEEKCGLVFEAGNVDALKNAILELYNKPEACKDMGQKGKDAVIKKYNWDIVGERIREMYSTLRNYHYEN